MSVSKWCDVGPWLRKINFATPKRNAMLKGAMLYTHALTSMVELWLTWEVWRALTELNLLSAARRAAYTIL